MPSPDSPRPCFLPDGVDFDALPENLRLAVQEILGPAYRELVLGASDVLERAGAVTFVHLMWLEILDEIGLGEHIVAGLPAAGRASRFAEPIGRGVRRTRKLENQESVDQKRHARRRAT